MENLVKDLMTRTEIPLSPNLSELRSVLTDLPRAGEYVRELRKIQEAKLARLKIRLKRVQAQKLKELLRDLPKFKAEIEIILDAELQALEDDLQREVNALNELRKWIEDLEEREKAVCKLISAEIAELQQLGRY